MLTIYNCYCERPRDEANTHHFTPMNNSKKLWQAWSEEEKARFQQLYMSYHKQFDKYLPFLQGRTKEQIQSFYYNNRKAKALQKQRQHAKEVQEVRIVVLGSSGEEGSQSSSHFQIF